MTEKTKHQIESDCIKAGCELSIELIPIIKTIGSSCSSELHFWAGFLPGIFGIAVAAIGPVAIHVITEVAKENAKRVADEHAH